MGVGPRVREECNREGYQHLQTQSVSAKRLVHPGPFVLASIAELILSFPQVFKQGTVRFSFMSKCHLLLGPSDNIFKLILLSIHFWHHVFSGG